MSEIVQFVLILLLVPVISWAVSDSKSANYYEGNPPKNSKPPFPEEVEE